MSNVLLISTYELGHQPFGLASPAAWLKGGGASVRCLDLAVEPLDETEVRRAALIAVYLPMHTATRLAIKIIPRLKVLNPEAHLCCFGLYAPANEPYLRELGVDSILGGEFESGLLALLERLSSAGGRFEGEAQMEPSVSLGRQRFLKPDRTFLPKLDNYAKLIGTDGRALKVGYTEASRGCKHLCRHCPIVPVYTGRFRIVQPEVVLADIRQQVAAGAQHITFGDPAFFNGPGHALAIVQALHDEFPGLSYDVTIKIEHLLKHERLLPVLRETGCLFITSAVEAIDDDILYKLDKGHTRADFFEAVGLLHELQLTLHPTFVPFTPWTTASGYVDLLAAVRDLDLVASVAPIQYAIRLLIPAGSRLLELPDIQGLVEPFDREALCHPWRHPHSEVDQLYERVFRLVWQNQRGAESREALFKQVWMAALEFTPHDGNALTESLPWDMAAKPVPHLSEPWYC